jgi:hypothetical protein
MGVAANLAESNGRQKPAAQSKFRCYIIEIGAELDFWRAALRITPYFCLRPGHLQVAPAPDGTFHFHGQLLGLNSQANRGIETGFLWLYILIP